MLRAFRWFACFEAVYTYPGMLMPGWVAQMKAVQVRMSRRTTVPVFSFGNGSKYYDEKTWVEDVRNIVEHNGGPVDFSNAGDDKLSKFEHGDAVVVRFRPHKGGKHQLFKETVDFQGKTSSAREPIRADSSTSSVINLQEPVPNNQKQRATEQPEKQQSSVEVPKHPGKLVSWVLWCHCILSHAGVCSSLA